MPVQLITSNGEHSTVDPYKVPDFYLVDPIRIGEFDFNQYIRNITIFNIADEDKVKPEVLEKCGYNLHHLLTEMYCDSSGPKAVLKRWGLTELVRLDRWWESFPIKLMTSCRDCKRHLPIDLRTVHECKHPKKIPDMETDKYCKALLWRQPTKYPWCPRCVQKTLTKRIGKRWKEDETSPWDRLMTDYAMHITLVQRLAGFSGNIVGGYLDSTIMNDLPFYPAYQAYYDAYREVQIQRARDVIAKTEEEYKKVYLSSLKKTYTLFLTGKLKQPDIRTIPLSPYVKKWLFIAPRFNPYTFNTKPLLDSIYRNSMAKNQNRF